MTNGNGHKPAPPRPQDYRCLRCGRLLFRAILPEGALVEIRCHKCGGMIHVEPLAVSVAVVEYAQVTA